VCPWNERGSQTTFNGKPTTACTKKKKLACIIPGDPAVNVYELQVPIASLSQLRQYHDWISQQSVPGLDRQLDVADVVTRLAWAQDKNFQLTFAPVGWTDARSVQVIEYVDQNKLMDVPLGRNDVALDPDKFQALPAPTAKLPTSAAQAPPQQFTLPPPPTPTGAGLNPPMPPPAKGGPLHPAQGQTFYHDGKPSQELYAGAPLTNAGVPPTKRTRGPNKPKTVMPSPQSTLAPPMQHSERFAASQSAPSWATPQPVPPSAAQPRQDAPAPPPPQAASGFMMPPPPPSGIQSALDAAMRLPLPSQG
jgi:hypothetical protein